MVIRYTVHVSGKQANQNYDTCHTQITMYRSILLL